MSSTVIRELFTRWGFKADTGAVKKFDKVLGVAKKGAKLASKAIAGIAVGAGVAAAGIIALVKVHANSADVIAKNSRKYGVASDTLQELDHAAQLSGTSIKQLLPGIKKLSVLAYDAGQGSKTAVDAFRELGIEVKDAGGKFKGTEQLLDEVLFSLAGLEDETLKAAIAQKLLGKSGLEVIPMLAGGADGLAAMRKEARDLGLVLDGETLLAAENFNDSLLRLTSGIKGIAKRFTGALFPILDKYLKIAGKWVKNNQKLISSKVSEWIAKISDAVKRIDLQEVIDGVTSFAAKLGVLVDAAALVAGAFMWIVDALLWVGKMFGIGLAELYLFGVAVNKWADETDAKIDGFVQSVINWFADLPGAIGDAFTSAAPAVAKFFGGIFDWITAIPGRLMDAISGGLADAVSSARAALGTAGDFIFGPGPVATAGAAAGPARAAAVSNSTRSVNISAPLSVQVAPGTSPVEARRLGAAVAGGATDAWRSASKDIER